MPTTPATIIIPAYQPTPVLVELAAVLIQKHHCQNIIVVDDGSGATYQKIFTQLSQLDVDVLSHTENKGKGQALKTAFNYWINSAQYTHSMAVVTADADGQHLPQDIAKIAMLLKTPSSPNKSSSNKLLLGVRCFDTARVPWRSRFGNKLTRFILRQVSQQDIQDTQTGLRGIGRDLVKQISASPYRGYEFEMDMLLNAADHAIPIEQINISTVYIDQNRTSHFNPILDSIKIYFVFLRFMSISLLSAGIDFGVFFLSYALSKNILLSVFVGRLISGIFNFNLNRRFAFRDNAKNKKLYYRSGVKYFLLAVALALISYSLIRIIHGVGYNVYLSKIFAETLLYLINFSIQRIFVFKRKDA